MVVSEIQTSGSILCPDGKLFNMKKNKEQKNDSLPEENLVNFNTTGKTEVKNANASGQGAFERSGEDLDKATEEETDEDQVY